MTQTNRREKPDLFDKVMKALLTLKIIFIDPLIEIARGFLTGALPTTLCWTIGIFASLTLLFHWDDRVLALFHRRSIHPGRFRDFLSLTSVFVGFLLWGYYRLGQRARIRNKLTRAFFNSGIETRLKETPEFYWDYPIDEYTRKLRVYGKGIPLSSYVKAREYLEAQLNIVIAKMETVPNNGEFVDIVYTTEKLPDFWFLDQFNKYKDFSFPIGRSFHGEISTSLKDIPHFLVAGESGGGKSSFIRMMLTVLLMNNNDLEIYFIDFKGGMENQFFEGFDNITLINSVQDAAAKLTDINRRLDTRMTDFKNEKARSIEMYNRSPNRKGNKEKRILVVVDEIAELMPTMAGKSNGELRQANFVINRIARMGRAVGIGAVIGVQKPDARNLDPTIKANLSGIVCFPVAHFNQSLVVLGNGRAADLNSQCKGRAIWKRGIEQVEVQTPHLTELEIADARKQMDRNWGRETSEASKEIQPNLEISAAAPALTSGQELAQGDMEVESSDILPG